MIKDLRVIIASHERQLVLVLSPITRVFSLSISFGLDAPGVKGWGIAKAEQTIRWLRVSPPKTGGGVSGGLAPGARLTVAVVIEVTAAGVWGLGLVICHPWVPPP